MSKKIHIEIDLKLPGANIAERDGFSNIVVDEYFLQRLLSDSFYRSYDRMLTLIENNEVPENSIGIINAKACISKRLQEGDFKIKISEDFNGFLEELDDFGYDPLREY